METKQQNILIRILAVLLISGGLLGISGVGLNVWSGYMDLKQNTLVLIELSATVAVYAWTTLKGIDLWRRLLRGYNWAKILFAAQIPVVASPSVNYGFYTGLGLDLVIGDVNSHIRAHIGSGFTLYGDPAMTHPFYGVNLVAIVALVYLTSKTRPNSESSR